VAKRKNGARLRQEPVCATGARGWIGRQQDQVHDPTGASVLRQIHIGKRPRDRGAYDAVVADLFSDHATCPDH
jgi:hypothetical protein